MIPALLTIVAVVGVVAFSVSALVARAGAPIQPAKPAESRSSTAATEGAEPRASAEKRAAPRSHVTFGAHESATQACDTCHTDGATEAIACRSCHANMCGKDAKTVADCLACHETGTTDTWVVDEP